MTCHESSYRPTDQPFDRSDRSPQRAATAAAAEARDAARAEAIRVGGAMRVLIDQIDPIDRSDLIAPQSSIESAASHQSPRMNKHSG